MTTADSALQGLLDRERIAEVIRTLFVSTDARDWERVQACFAPQVRFDMTSVTGVAPVQLSPAEIVAGWETGLRPIQSVHHQVGNLMVRCRTDEATAACYGIALHHRRTKSGRNTRTFVGSYDFHLRRQDGRWRIDLFRFNLKFVDGNLALEQEPGA